MIKKSAIQDYLNRDLDDWRWLKKVDQNAIYSEMEKIEPEPEFVYSPYACQLVGFWIAACLERFLFFYPMSSGKSKLAIDIIRQKMAEGEVKRSLVVIPRKANIQSWIDEVGEHAPELRIQPLLGTTEQKKMSLAEEADLYVCTYGSLQYLMAAKEQVKDKSKYRLNQTLSKKVIKRIDLVIADELHKCKNQQSLVFKCLRKLSHEISFAYGMTGTPASEPSDLWAQFYVIDKGETFGETLGLFRAVFYNESRNYWGITEYTFDKSMKKDFNRILQHRSLTYTPSEVKELPPHREINEVLTWSHEQIELYNELKQGMVLAHGDWQEMEGNYTKMRQLCFGYIDWKDPLTNEKVTVNTTENPKLEWIDDFIEDIDTDKVVFFYQYTTTGKMLANLLKKKKRKHRWIWSGCKDPIKEYNDFRNDPDVNFMIINNKSGDAGLQFQMAKYSIIVEMTESPIDHQQILKRCWRDGKGATDITYTIYLQMVNSYDGDILDSVKEGKNFIDELMNSGTEKKRIVRKRPRKRGRIK